MLTTLLVPTSGTAEVAGHDLLGDPVGVRRNIGYVAQGGITLPQARAGEEVVDQARLYGVRTDEARRRGQELFAQLDLDGLWERPCESLSGGQRRRLDIVIGLVHHPRLVFLDEPTTGLDPQSRANLWGHIRGLRKDLGATVFLTTHYLDEADALCDRLLVIDHGSIVAGGTPEELKRAVAGDASVWTPSGSSRTSAPSAPGSSLTTAQPGLGRHRADAARHLPRAVRPAAAERGPEHPGPAAGRRLADLRPGAPRAVRHLRGLVRRLRAHRR